MVPVMGHDAAYVVGSRHLSDPRAALKKLFGPGIDYRKAEALAAGSIELFYLIENRRGHRLTRSLPRVSLHSFSKRCCGIKNSAAKASASFSSVSSLPSVAAVRQSFGCRMS